MTRESRSVRGWRVSDNQMPEMRAAKSPLCSLSDGDLPHTPAPLPVLIWRPDRTGARHATARVHHAGRRSCGDVAGCGAGAAVGQAADHRIPGREHACGPRRMGRGLRAAATRTRLDRGSHHRDRDIAGRRTAPSAMPRLRPSLSGSRSTSSSTLGIAVPAVKQATSVIPIVFAVDGDPVGNGLVASLWHDRAATSPECHPSRPILSARDWSFCARLLPGLRRLAVLGNVGCRGAAMEIGEVQTAAHTLGLEVVDTLEIRQRRRHRARIQRAQGRSAGAVCVRRPTREHQPDTH